MFQDYHDADVIKTYNDKIEIESDYLSEKALLFLQRSVLIKVKERSVALETMPTSNVRISYYEQSKEHHLYRWLGVGRFKEWEEEMYRPDICIASDDPGIFATNLRNEFAHVYNTLTTDYSICHTEAINILKRINENCRVYRFEEKPAAS